jgi:hypothetical protein
VKRTVKAAVIMQYFPKEIHPTETTIKDNNGHHF